VFCVLHLTRTVVITVFSRLNSFYSSQSLKLLRQLQQLLQLPLLCQQTKPLRVTSNTAIAFFITTHTVIGLRMHASIENLQMSCITIGRLLRLPVVTETSLSFPDIAHATLLFTETCYNIFILGIYNYYYEVKTPRDAQRNAVQN
jgi:hypothetical protein